MPGELKFDQNGLIPVVVQDRASGDVLMVRLVERRGPALDGRDRGGDVLEP